MDKKDRILHSINAGRHKHANKGFGSWHTETLKEYARNRKRDAQGRFIKTPTVADKPRIRHHMAGKQTSIKEKDKG